MKTDYLRMRRDLEEPHAQRRAKTVPKAGPGSAPSTLDQTDATMESLQRSAGNAAVGQLLAGRGSSSAGGPLPVDLQARAERKLGGDLSSVRLHADAGADELVRSMKAEAATIGTDVYLGSQASDLSSSATRKTLLHELVHAAQAGHATSSPRGQGATTGSPETEARTIAASGFEGPVASVAQVAPAGVAHLKAIDEDEPRAEPDAEPQPAVTAEELLNPKTDEQDTAPKPGESGENEVVAYEISVMQPLRDALAKVETQDWDEAMAALQAVGMRLLDYQNIYEKRDPMLYTRIMSARGWLSLAVQHIGQRLGAKEWTDDQIADHVRDDVGEFEKIGSLIH